MTDLTNKTAAELAKIYNDLAKKSVKPTSYSKAKFIQMIEDLQPVIGEYTHCPHCDIHLSNGYSVHCHEDDCQHKTHEYCCLGCGEEFGPEIQELGDTFTLADLARSLGINPKLARSRYRKYHNDGVNTRYEFPKSKLEEVTKIITPKK